MKTYMKIIILLVLMSFFTFSGCTDKNDKKEDVIKPPEVSTGAESGDIVLVDYVGTFENGEIFDTSIMEIAEDDSLPKASTFQNRSAYSPLRFQLGMGGMIPGFENAMYGMEIGDEKTVTLPPEEAYGERNEDMIFPTPRQISFVRLQEVPYASFVSGIGREPVLDEELNVGLPWDSKIVNISEEMITFDHVPPEINHTVEQPNGVQDVTYNETHVVLFFTPVLNKPVFMGQGYVTYLEFNETSVVVDQNSPMAGKRLTFNIVMVDIIKPSATDSLAQMSNFQVLGSNVCEEDGKPIIYFFSGEFCPYCAMERWAFVDATSKFGTWTKLDKMESGTTDTYTFKDSEFESEWIVVRAWETDVEEVPADDNQKYLIASPEGSVPALNMACKYGRAGAYAESGQDLQTMATPLTPGQIKESQTLVDLICQLTDNEPVACTGK